MPKDDIEIDLLRHLFSFDPETGSLKWKNPRSPRVKPGAEAGRIGDQGYVTVGICGRFYRGHRVGFAIHFGRWPNGMLDHINGVRSDNRISNLRECTNAQNLRNAKRSSANTSGVKGVYFDKASMKWRALIRVDGKKVYLGYFATKEEAGCAYRKAATEHFGEFANHG